MSVGFYNDREHARVGVYKINQETDKYLAGAVFNLYTRDDIYDVDGNKLFSAGDLIATSPETVADGYTYFNCDVPIRGEWYGQSDRLDASTNSGNYFIRELRAPLGYYLNDAEMDVTFTYGTAAPPRSQSAPVRRKIMFLPKKHADLPIEPSVLESLRAQEKSLKREKRKAGKSQHSFP